MDWAAIWIMVTGALVAGSCALLGCFLVLRRLAMLGDAISHAVLPGIVLAFLWTNSTTSLPMFLGAAALGLITAFVVQTLSQSGVQGDAAIGVTFTSLFALGVVLVSGLARDKDLDLDCVLYGEIAYTPFDMLGPVPRAVVVSGILLLVNAVVVTLWYKEFKLCAFDPGMAAAVGIPVAATHYLLMALVSVTTVGAFDSVGAILVVAMLIVPAATAYLLTDHLVRMLLLAIGLGALASVGGYGMARFLGCSIAGAMATTSGVLFSLAFLFSPSQGFITRQFAQWRLRRTVLEEDVLLWAARRLEAEGTRGFTLKELANGVERLQPELAGLAGRFAHTGLLAREGERLQLTEGGVSRARELLRRHRLYETYLGELGYPVDHLHAAADRVEHHLSPALTRALDEEAHHPERDPQGKPIP